MLMTLLDRGVQVLLFLFFFKKLKRASRVFLRPKANKLYFICVPVVHVFESFIAGVALFHQLLPVPPPQPIPLFTNNGCLHSVFRCSEIIAFQLLTLLLSSSYPCSENRMSTLNYQTTYFYYH